MQTQSVQEVYSHLIPIDEGRLILPRASVNEVTGFTVPKTRPDDAPDWFLGMIDWQDHSIPVVSIEAACERSVPELGRRTRIAIIQCISRLLEPPVFALVTQGYPYLVRVNPGVLHFDEQGASNMRGPVLTAAKMANERPIIPDLEKIEQMIADVLGVKPKEDEEDILDSVADVDVGDVGIKADEVEPDEAGIEVGEVDPDELELGGNGDLEVDTGGIEVEDTGNDLDLGLGDDD